MSFFGPPNESPVELVGAIPETEVVENSKPLESQVLRAGDLVLVLRSSYVWKYGIFLSNVIGTELLTVQVEPIDTVHRSIHYKTLPASMVRIPIKNI